MLKFKSICAVLLITVTHIIATAQKKNDFYILDMVQNNPGEPLTETIFNDPAFLAKNGYTGQVITDFTFVHAAITYDKLNPTIFPEGSEERAWVLAAAERIRNNIKKAHKAGIKIYYQTDIIILPKKLVEIYKDEIMDSEGRISFERPKTIEIHRAMLKEVFETFPDLDGLIIRTGETYLDNVPYHTGNGPITNAEESHVKLINLLRDEVCVKRNKMLFYRTWSFGGMHENPDYYLNVTNRIEKHPNLVFSIKHIRGDYRRLYDFNPTITIGKHPQIVEVQCQREYEGKGAYPNYVMNGVINGFEEYFSIAPQTGFKGLNDIKNMPNFRGIWSWSRGGGWVGPYIKNELWCRLNAYVISHWAQNTDLTEEQVFNNFMDESGIKGESRKKFRELCMLSSQAVLRGHATAKIESFQRGWVWWTRDEFLGGIHGKKIPDSNEPVLLRAFEQLYKDKKLDEAVEERYEAIKIFDKMVQLSKQITMSDKEDQQYLFVSSKYGLLLHKIIAEGWKVMALGYTGDQSGTYDKTNMAESIKLYHAYWDEYKQLEKDYPSCATLYKPYAFVFEAPNYHGAAGMGASVAYYESLIHQ
ncbi:hypothetical protein ACFOET_08900 [Parapedobacter deserti]|uniref:Glycosyl hydrolase family 67 N-terminus n=1 Tax=Parapedobacter deserti TaxID=1912957 RepID=A0ABV7JLN0_9SPHI